MEEEKTILDEVMKDSTLNNPELTFCEKTTYLDFLLSNAQTEEEKEEIKNTISNFLEISKEEEEEEVEEEPSEAEDESVEIEQVTNEEELARIASLVGDAKEDEIKEYQED